MKKYLFCFYLCLISLSANAEIFHAGNYPDIVSFSGEDIIVDSGAVITPVYNQNITIIETFAQLHNNGTINGTLNTNGNILRVYNTGTISGGITSSINSGEVRQMITSQSEITSINVVGVNHVVEVNYNNNNISFNDIKDLPSSSFSLSGARVIIDDFSVWQSWGKNVSLDGPVWLVINNKNTVVSGEAINNIVSGANEYLCVVITDLDSSDSIELTPSGQTKILKLVNVLNNDIAMGTGNDGDGPLEKIRQNNPNDKLVVAIDSANNENERRKIRKNSYRFNHDILLRPIKVINNFAMFNRLDDVNEMGLGMHVDYIMSDAINDFGGRIYFGNNFDELYLNVGFNFNSFSYEDKLNDFSGKSYGLDIRAKQDIGPVWIDGLVGVTLVQYDADYITSKNKLSKDPFGTFEYAKIDVGHNFEVVPDVVLSPFAGVGVQQYNIADVSDFDLNIRSGVDLKYNTVMDGIKYEYVLSGAFDTNGDWFSSIKVGFWSITDKVGASLNASVYKNDIDYNYKLSFNAKTIF